MVRFHQEDGTLPRAVYFPVPPANTSITAGRSGQIYRLIKAPDYARLHQDASFLRPIKATDSLYSRLAVVAASGEEINTPAAPRESRGHGVSGWGNELL